MAEIYKDFLTQFNVPSTQLKMESKKDDSCACACFSMHSGLPHGQKWRTVIVEVSTVIGIFYQMLLASKA